MIHSMTGFASAQTQIGARLLRLELRSVNGRFLDLYFRLPEDWRSFEPLLRERLQKALARGKIECRLEVQSAPVQAALTLDAVQHSFHDATVELDTHTVTTTREVEAP